MLACRAQTSDSNSLRGFGRSLPFRAVSRPRLEVRGKSILGPMLVRLDRRGRAAELERTAASGEPDQRAMAAVIAAPIPARRDQPGDREGQGQRRIQCDCKPVESARGAAFGPAEEGSSAQEKGRRDSETGVRQHGVISYFSA